MDIKLIKQIQEADLFSGPSPDDVKGRKNTRRAFVKKKCDEFLNRIKNPHLGTGFGIALNRLAQSVYATIEYYTASSAVDEPGYDPLTDEAVVVVTIGLRPNGLDESKVNEDLFSGPSKKELKQRKAERPPVILSSEDLVIALRQTITTMILDLDLASVMDNILDGTPITSKPLVQMTVKELAQEALLWAPAYDKNYRREASKITLMRMIRSYSSEQDFSNIDLELDDVQ